MPLALNGPLTTAMESAAAAVAAGMLLGGFLAGLVGLVRRWPRHRFVDASSFWAISVEPRASAL
jgi:hypothetical protein